MDDEQPKRIIPSTPSNFLTLAQLQERWLQRKQREKEEEEEEEARRQKQKEEEEENRKRREKEQQQRKLRIQQTRKWQTGNRERPRSNNVPLPPFHRNSQNQCPGRGAGDNEVKPKKTHIGEVAAEEAELKIDASIKVRHGWKKREPIYGNRQNQCPGGGTGDDEQKPEETHPVADVAEPKIDDSAESTSGPKKTKPFYRNRQNQFPGRGGGGGGGGDELKPEETHTVAEAPEPKIVDSMERTSGPKKTKPFHRNRQSHSPDEGAGDSEVKLGKTHTGDVVPEDVGLKIDDSIQKSGSKKRGKPKAQKEDRTDDLLPELERNFEKISLSGGEGFNGRRFGYSSGGHHRYYVKNSGGLEWQRKRNSNLVWIKKEEVDSDVNAA